MRINKILRFAVSVLLIAGLARGFAVEKVYLDPIDPVQAMKTLQSSTVNGHYWEYQRYYQGQITDKTCALASAAIVMNTLDVEAPMVPELYPKKLFTQKNFLNEKNSAIRSFKQIEVDGVPLPELAQMFTEGWGVSASVYYGSNLSLEKFRKTLVDALASSDERVIVNFKSDMLKVASQGGHISPAAAYNKETDEVLLMDVARHRNGPYWVGVERLYQAVGLMDSSSKKSRGLLIVKAK